MRYLCIYKPAKPEGAPPTQGEMAEMGKYIEQSFKSGTLLATEGCLPSALGARVRLTDGNFKVTDGPFTESKELIAGFWIWQVKSLEEAIEWVKRCPNPHAGDSEIEIRQVFEMEEFAPILSEEEIRYKVAKRAELPNQTANK